MESDWAAVRLVDAAVAGVADFRQARLLDPRWFQRLTVVLSGLDRKTQLDVMDAKYRFYLAQVASADTAETRERAFKVAEAAYYDYLGALRPWSGKTYVDRKKRELRTERQAYIDAYGVDPSDPAFKKWEAAAIAAAVADRDKRTRTSDEVVVERMQKKRK